MVKNEREMGALPGRMMMDACMPAIDAASASSLISVMKCHVCMEGCCLAMQV